MTTVLTELYYNDNHLWIRKESQGAYVVGLSDYAQSQLGNILLVGLPEAGDTVITGDDCALTESEKTNTDLYAPISGEIIEVNYELIDSPSLINNDPYFDGWLYKIEASDESELEELLDNEQYQELLPDSDSDYAEYEEVED